MADQKRSASHSEIATAIIATCIVQTLNEFDQTFQERFLKRLKLASRHLQDQSDGNLQPEFDLIAATQQLLER